MVRCVVYDFAMFETTKCKAQGLFGGCASLDFDFEFEEVESVGENQ